MLYSPILSRVDLDSSIILAQIRKWNPRAQLLQTYKVWKEEYGYFLEIFYSGRMYPVISLRTEYFSEVLEYLPEKVRCSGKWKVFHD